MPIGRVLTGVVALWLTVIGILIGWTWAMFELFQEGENAVGAIVGFTVPAAVVAVSLLAWGTRTGEGR